MSTPAPGAAFGAILLAGGRGSRVDGAVKPLFEIRGRTLLQAAVDAVRDADAQPVTVAAPVLDPGLAVDWVREDPPFGGPVAGIVAALDSWSALDPLPEWTFLLACDLPRVGEAVARLVADLALQPRDVEGLCLTDASSRPQWLTGVYRTAALRDAASALPVAGRDAPVRALLADLAIAVVSAPDAAADIDTWEDYRKEQTMAEHLPPEALDAWADALCKRFGLTREDVPIPLILDLARDVSKGVARPAAPFSAYVAGLVAGRAGGTSEDVADAVAAITEMAEGWHA